MLSWYAEVQYLTINGKPKQRSLTIKAQTEWEAMDEVENYCENEWHGDFMGATIWKLDGGTGEIALMTSQSPKNKEQNSNVIEGAFVPSRLDGEDKENWTEDFEDKLSYPVKTLEETNAETTV